MPVLDFTFNEGQINIINKSKTVVQATLSLSAFYFNPYVSHWEPFIEPIGFVVDLNYSPKNNPKYYVIIQANEKYSEIININISLDMVNIKI